MFAMISTIIKTRQTNTITSTSSCAVSSSALNNLVPIVYAFSTENVTSSPFTLQSFT